MKYSNLQIISENIQGLPLVATPMLCMVFYIISISIIRFSRLILLIYSIVLLVGSILFVMWLGIVFPQPNNTDSILWYIPYVLILYSWGFPMMQYYFNKRWINDPLKFYKMLHPQDASDTVEYHLTPRSVIVTAYLSRYSLLAGIFSLVLIGFIAVMFRLDMFERPGWYFMCFSAMIWGFFTFCMAYLRIFIKCPNCDLEIFHVDQHFSAYTHTAKYAIKQKIIQCVHCNAVYILDKNKDFEMAKNQATAMINKRKAMEKALEGARGINHK